MNFQKVKLVISDMDGTLLNSRGEVGASLFTLIDQLRKKNVIFGVASGRQYYSLAKKLEQIAHEIIFIAENGAIAIEGEKEIHLQPMEKEQANKLISEVRKIEGKYLILSGRKQAYIESTDPAFMDPFLKHYEKYKVVEDLKQVEDDIFLKLTVCDLDGAEENSYPKLKHLKNEFQMKLSGEIWIDFNHPEAQKGNALKKVQEIKGISAEETLTFGDYFNDIELFQNSGFSFAMENSHPEVKEHARFSTGSNDKEGVEQVLKKLLEGREK